MNIQNISAEFARAAQNLPQEQKDQLLAMLLKASRELDARKESRQEKKDAASAPGLDEDGIPNGMTERLQRLKAHYMKQQPSISIHAARAKTRIMKENPGLPPIELRGKAFRYSCETAPLVIQDDELIVGAPCGAPRAGAFSPDIAWRWLRDELETVGIRPQDPFFISEEDKRVCREEIFPFWEGKSVDEYCETQYRECGGWELSGESFVSDCSYHATSGGGDSNPGYDVILMKKGMLDAGLS